MKPTLRARRSCTGDFQAVGQENFVGVSFDTIRDRAEQAESNLPVVGNGEITIVGRRPACLWPACGFVSGTERPRDLLNRWNADSGDMLA